MLSEQLLSATEVAEWLNVSKDQIRRWTKENHNGFPQPIRFNQKTRRWRREDIDRWLESKATTGEGT